MLERLHLPRCSTTNAVSQDCPLQVHLLFAPIMIQGWLHPCIPLTDWCRPVLRSVRSVTGAHFTQSQVACKRQRCSMLVQTFASACRHALLSHTIVRHVQVLTQSAIQPTKMSLRSPLPETLQPWAVQGRQQRTYYNMSASSCSRPFRHGLSRPQPPGTSSPHLLHPQTLRSSRAPEQRCWAASAGPAQWWNAAISRGHRAI